MAVNSKSTIAFYNLENLFNTYDDRGKKDEEFLPCFEKGWNLTRYHKNDHLPIYFSIKLKK